MRHFRGADDRGRHAGLVQQPGQGDLGVGDAAPPGHLASARSTTAKSVSSIIQLVGVSRRSWRGWSRRGPARGLRLPARKPRASGLHGISPIPSARQSGIHLALFLAVDQVVMVLHRDEPGQPQPVRRVQHLGRICQAYIDEAPMYSALPALTTSVRASSVSSIGVADRSGGSGRGRRSRCRAASGWRRSNGGCACATGPARSDRLPMGLKTLVAMTTLSRPGPMSCRARPRISSLTPSEYMSAVSKKLMPSSRARRIEGPALFLVEDPLAPFLRAVGHACPGRCARPSRRSSRG